MKLPRLVVLAIGLLLGISAQGATSIIRLATTISTENSGLLVVLLPPFERDSGYRVHVIAVDTGKALRLVREGDVDVVLVHTRADGDKLIADGYGVHHRRAIQPASAAWSGALSKIAATASLFVSRGDESGTHKKEQALWQQAKITPAGPWYREAGQGMGKILLMAGELDAYTLTDRGTWLAYRDRSPLEVLAEGDERQFNPYGVIATNPDRYLGAMRLIEWIASSAGQAIIHTFRHQGEPLFIPMVAPMGAGARRGQSTGPWPYCLPATASSGASSPSRSASRCGRS